MSKKNDNTFNGIYFYITTSTGMYLHGLNRKSVSIMNQQWKHPQQPCCFHGCHGNKYAAFLAHLSQRLIGELIVYQWYGVRRRRPSLSSTMLKHLLLRNRLANQTKFYVEPPWVGGTKFCSRHLGHMTKMAATPIYGKNPSKIFFSRTSGPIFTKLGM